MFGSMANVLPLAGVILDRSALATGFMAAAIAVGGFVSGARAILGGAPEADAQRETAAGGLWGLLVSIWLALLDVGIG